MIPPPTHTSGDSQQLLLKTNLFSEQKTKTQKTCAALRAEFIWQ